MSTMPSTHRVPERSRAASGALAPQASRYLSEAECKDVMDRLARVTRGGYAAVHIQSSAYGNVRWARNQTSTSGDVSKIELSIVRELHGGTGHFGTVRLLINDISDTTLAEAMQRADYEFGLSPDQPRNELVGQGAMIREYPLEPALTPNIFSASTDQLDADRRAAGAQSLVRSATDAGMLSAGYVQVGSHSRAVLDTVGHTRYFKWTTAQYSVTVRDPKGTGSGWAGMDHHDWAAIDGGALTRTALDKCLASRNPSRIEPGRYTVVLEPQAVCDLVAPVASAMNRIKGEEKIYASDNPFNKGNGFAELGEKVMDERLMMSTDPMDPENGYPPWVGGEQAFLSWDSPAGFLGSAFRAATWVDRGVLVNMSYDRAYAANQLHRSTGIGGSDAFRLTAAPGVATVSVDAMISSTKRGLLVTRFDRLEILSPKSLLTRGYTRDGVWLIENGKITRSAMNLMFLDSPLFALTKVEQIGVSKRTFRPAHRWVTVDPVGPSGVIVPALKVSDFSFTALSDAV